MTLIYFALLLGGLIFFHEFGHFIVARACGIRVLEFSIGFGPEVAAIERGGTVYRIGALPLGGFVRMLGADPMEELSPEDEADSFNSKALWKRTLVVLAGPVFNLILPFFVFFFLFINVGQVAPALVGTLEPDGVAERAGFKSGDIIKSIDDETITGWWEVQRTISASGGKTLSVVIERDGQDLPAVDVTPATVVETVAPELGVEREVGRVQIALTYRKPLVVVEEGGAAHASGLRSWDMILSVDGRNMEQWEVARRALEEARKPVEVTFLRVMPSDGSTALPVDILQPARTVTFDPSAGTGVAGIKSAEFVVHEVMPDSVEAKAGLQRGDEIVRIDGRRFALWGAMIDYIRNKPGKSLTLEYRRGQKEHSVQLEFEQRTVKVDFNTEVNKVLIGLLNFSAYGSPERVENLKVLDYATYNTWVDTSRVFTLTLASLAGLFTGKVEFKQMGGPIFIYEVASRTGEEGWGYFFNVMVWLSISLGLINLLPVPLLDGGHLAFFLIEAIKRSPVSLRTRQIASYIGLSMIIVLMVMVFKNDIQRNWDSVIAIFQ